MKKTKPVKDTGKSPTSKVTGSYSIPCACNNCGKSGTATFPRGIPVPDKFECPNCGCCTAYRKNPNLPCVPNKPGITPYIPIQPYLPWNEEYPYKQPPFKWHEIWCGTADEVHKQGVEVTCGLSSKIGSEQHSKDIDIGKFTS